ncbi:cell division protein FtsI (penicillin-binding protein 3) [Enhydrobacter aerosaccus]|uniref:Cell division protein FtsI (Penicillin-binding protein 3) n=1 Tax=Enhydrobacter aerosaccus TaxID=225324 RepID=A0A1T4JPH6_9HYPH|nr:penicillin-binding protein 2 [Enhydrobacter aerosaccus]SJZ32039.1 cell division protein FtsI (penicillin-binding protein 3) [Enhydrobacter aerosaccus]
MRLWRKAGPPEPAAAPRAAAGTRPLSARERTKGDAQETARQRLVIASALLTMVFVAIALRMAYVSLLREGGEPTQRVAARGGAIQSERADIVDRNGIVFATSLPVMSAFVNPHLLVDTQDAARKIVSALPDLKYDEVKEKLDADKSFVWIKRGLSPRENDLVNRLGIPGLEFQAEERRIYPQGQTGAHVVGYTSIDNAGLGGVERYFDQQLQSGQTVQLSIDLRLQRMVEDEIAHAVQKFSAIGAQAIVMDATNGEILAMASLPTYDANKAKTITNEALFNRATLGVYEQGSMFKVFNTALALDSGKVTLADKFDASSPIKIDRFTIHDDPDVPHRVLTVPEVFKFSSNIGSAKMAVEVGSDAQRAFFDRLGFLKPLNTQLTELGSPLYPAHWAKINTMTIAFGHGMSVTPLHLITGVAAMVNGGVLYSPSFLKRTSGSDPGRRVIQAKTSQQIRQLMRLNAVEGTGKKADLTGYEVGGKTGTAEKVSHGGYAKKALFSSFVGAFPMSDPKFLVLVSLDEPKGTKETGGYATGGMVSAPSVKVIIEDIVSLYGILPGDWNSGRTSLEVASTPVQPSPMPQLLPVAARGQRFEHRALPARPTGPMAAPPAGVRRVTVE